MNVGTAGDGAKIGYNVIASSLQELRELQEKKLQERGVYFLLFFYLENVNI